jgi:sugar phosphate isomerase/epimerase
MKDFKVGIQLYSVRDHMNQDFYGTLKAIKNAGYDYVEFAGYFGKSAEEIRAMLDELGLECISVHEGAETYLNGGKAAVDFLNTIGAKYSAIPWYPIEKLKGDFDATVEKFKKTSDLLAEGSIRLLYHNHDFEFQKLEANIFLIRYTLRWTKSSPARS